MNGWKISSHVREVSKWNSDTRRRESSRVNSVECRKKFGDAHVLITARYTETLVSMNGTASLTTFDLREMSEIMAYAQDCVHRGIQP